MKVLSNKGKLFLIFYLFSMTLTCCSSKNNAQDNAFSPKGEKAQPLSAASFSPGEKITYTIKSLGVKAGEATLSFAGTVKDNGKDVCLIIFTARAANFYDEEKIYADPKSFYPLKVERDLNIWGKKEKITEEYDQTSGRIKITKLAQNKAMPETIEKKGPIDNIYCFIYRYRQSGEFKIGDSFLINLPTRNVTIDLVKKTSVKAAGKVYESYYMQSDPAKYKLWFDTGEGKIPLRINGAVGISDTAMIMEEYKEGKNNAAR